MLDWFESRMDQLNVAAAFDKHHVKESGSPGAAANRILLRGRLRAGARTGACRLAEERLR